MTEPAPSPLATTPHVALVTEQVRPGGKRSHVEALRAGLEAIGWRTSLVDWKGLSWPERACVAAPARALDLLRRGLGHRWLVPALRGRFEPRLRALARRDPLSAIHVQEPLTLEAARRAGGRVPVVLTVHGPMHREVASAYGLGIEHPVIRFLKELERRAYLDADAVVSVDQPHAEYVRGFGRRERVWVIENFVDMRRFHAGALEQPFPAAIERWLARRPVILCTRRLVPKNGVEVAIRAARILEQRRIPCALVVVGGGPRRRALESLVRDLAAEQAVCLLGEAPQARLPGWCRRAAAVVVPSVPSMGVEEATSISALEAQACARPVVASALGGIPEIVEDGRTGILSPPGDAEALASALERILTDGALARRLGEAAAVAVAEKHTHVVAARRFVEVYRAVGATSPAS